MTEGNNMDLIFIYMQSADGGSDQFYSLYQIVRVDGITNDSITLHMSDGNPHIIHGELAVSKLLTRLVEHAMSIDGESLMEVITKEPREGPKLIKFTDPKT